MINTTNSAAQTLHSPDQWDEDVRERYDTNRKPEEFRQYGDGVPPAVRDFYRLNHTNQTLALARGQPRADPALMSPRHLLKCHH